MFHLTSDFRCPCHLISAPSNRSCLALDQSFLLAWGCVLIGRLVCVLRCVKFLDECTQYTPFPSLHTYMHIYTYTHSSLLYSLQQLNAGGAITGPPKPSKQKRQAPTNANERYIYRHHDSFQPYIQTHTHSPFTPHTHTYHTHTPRTHTIIYRKVEALYNNIAEDADELSFTKGDVMIVKEQINEEWIICSNGNQTGIVPMNYVKVIL